MLKNSSLRRVTVATMALFILAIFYLFPVNKDTTPPIPQIININNNHLDNPIYLLDKNNYIARVNILFSQEKPIEKAKEIISTLTMDSEKKEYIPTGFNAIIPANTKIVDISLKDKLLKVNFSKEILKVDQENEEKMIEAITYSLTTIDDIENIVLFVEGEQLFKLPYSQKKLPLRLNRDYGINKVYDIDNIKNTIQTTIYYISKNVNSYYYVPVSYITNDKASKIEIIIQELKSSATTQTNLMSFLAANAELLDYELEENKINLSFNEYLLEDLTEKNIIEEVKYAILYSIKDNYKISEVSFFVNGEKIEDLSINELK